MAISQACYATGENHERAVLRQLLGELDLEGLLIQADALHTQIVEVIAIGIRDGKTFRQTHVFLTSLRTIPHAQLHKDAHRYRGNGAGTMATRKPEPSSS